MEIKLNIHACAKGKTLPLLPDFCMATAGREGHICDFFDFSHTGVGDVLYGDAPLFLVSGFSWLEIGSGQNCRVPLLTALRDFPGSSREVATFRKSGYSLAVITLSDKGAQGLRQDLSGPEISRLVQAKLDICLYRNFLVPDDGQILKALLADLAFNQKFDLVFTTGGTGVGARDVTPQNTAAILELELPGFAQAMMAASLQKTPHAIISRSVAGIAGRCIIVNLPGSVKAARENLQAILPALPHTLQKINGDNTDCGG